MMDGLDGNTAGWWLREPLLARWRLRRSGVAPPFYTRRRPMIRPLSAALCAWRRGYRCRDCLRRRATYIRIMPYHRFKVGQTVVAPFDGSHALIPRGPLIILRLLPLVDGDPQYRVRCAADGLERVVLESQIRPEEEPSAEMAKPAPSKPNHRR